MVFEALPSDSADFDLQARAGNEIAHLWITRLPDLRRTGSLGRFGLIGDIETRLLALATGSDGMFEIRRHLIRSADEIAELLDESRDASST